MDITCPYCKKLTRLIKPFKCKECDTYINPYLFIKPKAYEKLKSIRLKKDLTLKFNQFIKPKIETIFGDQQDLKVRYYQIQGILHFLLMKRFLLGDATGIGKTIQSILAFSYMLDKDESIKALVVAPKSAINQWSEEFKKFTININPLPVISKGGLQKREILYEEFKKNNFHVLIINYHLLVRDFSLIAQTLGPNFVCYFDEAAAFKTRGSKTWSAVHEISKLASGAFALTATPIKNKLEEIYSIYKAIYPNLFPGPATFQKQYCKVKLIRKRNGRGKIPLVTGYKNLKEFREIIDPFYLGRKVDDIGEQLPDLTFKDIHVELTKKQVEKYKEALAGLIQLEDGTETEVTKLTSITYCQEIVSNLELIKGLSPESSKEGELYRMLEEDLVDEKVIIHTRFRSWIDIIETELLKRKIPILRITGAEDDETRELNKLLFLKNEKKIAEYVQKLKEAKKWKKIPQNVREYVEEGLDPKVIILNKAGIEAINLQSARVMILLDIPISYGDYFQLLGRSRRLDSLHKKILVIHMVAKLPSNYRCTTIDEKMVKIVRSKKSLNDALFGEAFDFRFEGDMLDQLYKELKEDGKNFK